MEDRGGSFVAVRRISQGIERGNTCHSTSGSAAWLGRGLSCVCAQRREGDARPSFDLTPAQEESLQRLQSRIDVAYDSSILEHQEALRALWHAAFPEEELSGLISEQWKEMGWQGKDPSTDFRGGGFISLENLLFFAKNFPGRHKTFSNINHLGFLNFLFYIFLLGSHLMEEYLALFLSESQRSLNFRDLSLTTSVLEGHLFDHLYLLRKQEGDRSMWEYPFAVAGVNITFMLIQMLDLEAVKPRTLVGATFLKFLSENESAFDLLYCITFKLMDNQWLAMRASYMDFNAVMKSTRRQMERELLLEDVTRLEDLPSYGLLAR
ncbi:hypothetical protein BT93_G0291 [Corymbia citriodora subsp. variegata]|nr:hypothetical protein BT93_G0291 [Corymbia citriodora subsp. variegata]